MSFFGLGETITGIFNVGMQERQIDRDADAADTAWRRGQENMGISNAFAAEQADIARQWQQGMSSSAHQREVADLRAAGLNPILSANRGAAVPGGASASSAFANAPMQAPAPDYAKGITSALAAKRLEVDIENTKADTLLKEQQRSLTNLQANTETANYQKRVEETETQKNLTEAAKHNASILSNSAKGAELEGDIDETTYGKVMRYINRSMRAITGGASAYRNSTAP